MNFSQGKYFHHMSAKRDPEGFFLNQPHLKILPFLRPSKYGPQFRTFLKNEKNQRTL